MASVNKAALKTYFNAGDEPTEANFVDVFDSLLSIHADDDTTVAGDTTFSGTTTCSGTTALSGATTLSNLILGNETLTAAGAASILVPLTLINAGSDGIAITLANGTTAGQVKIFTSLHATNAATITPATTDGAYATFTLTNIGESVNCVWTGTGWAIIGRNSGAVHSSATGVVGYPIFA